MVATIELQLTTDGDGDIIDITEQVRSELRKSGVNSGIVTVFAIGSTGGITTIEYEPGLREDFPDLMERLVPSGVNYKHDQTWHDGNGFSHLRSAVIGTSFTVPFIAGKLALGTWQQIVFCEFDNRPRDRRVLLQIMGE